MKGDAHEEHLLAGRDMGRREHMRPVQPAERQKVLLQVHTEGLCIGRAENPIKQRTPGIMAHSTVRSAHGGVLLKPHFPH